MNEDIPSGIVQEVDCAERVVVLKVRMPGRTALVIVGAAKQARGVGLLPRGARQELWAGRLPPGSARQRAREDALMKARVLSVSADEVRFVPWSKRPENPAAQPGAFEQGQATATTMLVRGGRVVIAELPLEEDLPPFIAALETQAAFLEARGRALAEALAADALEIRRAELGRALEKALARLERRRRAIQDDLAKISEADQIAAQASLLVAEAGRVPRGATELVVNDWSSGEAVPVRILLDPSKAAREQVAAMFKRAKRLKLGRRIAEERLAQVAAHDRAVLAALEGLRHATSLLEMEASAREAKVAAPRDVVLPGASTHAHAVARENGKRVRVAFRSFAARSGAKILVGKGAADNDTLTLRVAKPHDLWLHAKNRTGGHVIVPLPKGQSCPAEDLVDAAHLAAHFSDARNEKVVDVQYASKRFLHKPKGSPPGAVVVSREKVIALRFDPAILRQLLEREDI